MKIANHHDDALEGAKDREGNAHGDDALLIALATPASVDDAIATLEARNNPATYFARYCEHRSANALDDATRNWWHRMAGNARKAATM